MWQTKEPKEVMEESLAYSVKCIGDVNLEQDAGAPTCTELVMDGPYLL
jgi:hypothetical protein